MLGVIIPSALTDLDNRTEIVYISSEKLNIQKEQNKMNKISII